ncbi:hypothetical protein SLS55_000967 [Diplodia seriata]|uniref:Ankyrin repeat protein n=1 Tax=Diplodia seriata TaxID=420778 RepID=A0ABR3CVU8_9PEZI
MADMAVKHDRADLLQHLLATGTSTDYIPRKEIVHKRSTTLLQVLLDNGWDINDYLGGYMGCALTQAILTRADVDFIAWLLERGADPNGPPGGIDHCGYALRLAMQITRPDDPAGAGAGPSRVARMLVERGADVDLSKALHVAAEKRGVEWVRWLVEVAGADVDAPGLDPDWACATDVERGIGRPLHYAARNPDPAVARYLVERGADRGQKDTSGRTPREVAELLGHGKQARILAVEEGESR